jgi:hypothetical protein
MNEFELAAYVDHRLGAAERARVEHHLADCAECRQEVVAVGGLLRRAARPRRWILATALLASAAGLLVILRPEGGEPLRATPVVQQLMAYGPVGETPLARVRFVWAAVRGATSYRLTLTSHDGAPLWSVSLADTTVALPDSVRLLPERGYFWVADALLDDGSSRSTGLREFRPVR